MEKKTYIKLPRSVIIGLFFIVILAFIVRIVMVSSLPPSLNWDEVSHGYNAYSILKTGKDEWGKLLPLAYFRAYGDYPLPLNLYLTIPFIFIFGLTEFAIRLPHVMLGTLAVISTFWLAFGLTKNRKIALISSFLVAVSPWTLFTSRFVIQSNLSVFLLTTSLACFFNREKSEKLVTWSFLLLGLSLYAYNTTRIIAPTVLLAYIIFYRSEKLLNLKNKIILVLFFLPLPFILLNSNARARSFAVSIINEGSINRIIENRQQIKLPEPLPRILSNKVTYFIGEFSKNYIGYFSPNFLFLKGGTQYQFSIPNRGLIYWINLPLFYIGLFVLLKKVFKKDVNYLFLLTILLLAPIPAAMTTEKFAVLRSSAMIPIPMILSSIGLFYTIRKLKLKNNEFIIFLFIFLNLLFLENYMVNYISKYSKDYSQSWQYGYKEVTEYIKENTDNYAKIIVTKKYGEPHEFLLFFLKFDPKRYTNDKNLVRFNQSSWWWVDAFDKYYFVNDWQIPKEGYKFLLESKKLIDCRQAKCLLVTSPNNAPKEWNKVKTINFLDGQPAFELYENN